ncbi:MAG: hypothetical protein HOC95_04040, partial [Candidatus Diapherotrites archaeon]|nr:hypothetical protein [Candidatus Diapherotrites archaeon]
TKLASNAVAISLGGNVFVRVDSSSFRRHILYETDAVGEVLGSYDLKIPGAHKHKIEVALEDFDVSNSLGPIFGDTVQRGIAVLEYPAGDYRLYGQTMNFGRKIPFRISVSSYDIATHETTNRLNDYLSKNRITESEAASIEAQVNGILEKVEGSGWVGRADLSTLQNLGIRNLPNGQIEIYLVNDFADYTLASTLTPEEAAKSLRQSFRKIRGALKSSIRLTKKEITFTCNSPCEWDSTGHRVKVVEGTNVEITGEFDEGHIAEVRTQRYTQNATDTKEATTGLDAEETEQAIDGFSQGKTVAILAGAASGKQEIKVYFKKELVDEEITGLAAQTEQSETTNTENSPAETIRGESFVINTAKENPETIMDLGRVGSLVTISDSLANLGRKMFVPKTGLNSLEKKAVMLMLAMRLMTAIGNPEINYGVKSFNEYYGTLNVHPIASVEQAEDIVAQATNDKGLTAIQKETTTVSCPVVASFASIKFADAGEGASCTFTNGSQVTSFVRDATKTEFAVNAKLTLPHRIEQQTTITYSQIDDLEELLQFTGLTPDNTKDYGFTLALLRIGRIVYIIVPSEIDGKEDLILLLPANENTGVNSLPKTIPLTDLVGKQSSVSTAFQVTRNLTDPFTGAKDWPKFSSINMSEIPVGTRFVVSGYFGDRTYDYHFKKISDTKMLICSGADLSQGFIFKIGQMYSMVGENLVTADVYPATFVEQSTVAYPYFNFVNGKLIPLSQLPQSKDKEIFGPVEKIRVEPQTNSFVTPKQNYSKTTVVASDGTEFKFGMQLKDSPARTDAYGATIGHKVFGELRLLKMTDFPNANATLLFRLEEGSDGTFTAVAGHYGSTTGGLADIIEESSTEFSVAKTLQTKYSGIGTTLLDMAVHKAKEFGATEFELIDAIRSAIPFYESYGFECVETNFVSGKHDCRLNLATKTIPQYTITRRSKIFQTINADAFKTGLTSNTFTYEFRDNLMRDFIYTNQVDAQYNQFLPDSFHADAPLTPVKVIGFFDGKQSHIRFLQIPKLSREDTWPNSQAEWEMHALAILIRDVKGASLTQAETDAINDALLGNADFPDFVLQNAFAADVIVQGNYVHGVIEARSPLHTQVISNQTQLDQQTRLALRQEMINNIDPNMVIERYYDWEITVDPSLSALEQQ